MGKFIFQTEKTLFLQKNHEDKKHLKEVLKQIRDSDACVRCCNSVYRPVQRVRAR